MTPRRTIPRPIWLKLGASLLAANHLSGQTVLMTSPAPKPQSQAMADSEKNNPMNVFLPLGGTPETPFKYGPLIFRPHASYAYSYSTGVQSQPGKPQDTQINTLTAGLTVDLGQHWVLEYTPTFRFYSNKDFSDGVDHAVSFSGGTHYGDWGLGFSQGYTYSTAPTVQTGTQARQQNYSTALSANYAFSSKMSADFGLSQGLNFVSDSQDSRTWSTMDWLNYQFWKRLNAGIGVGAGYVSISDTGGGTNNPDQIYEQVQGRINWRATDKVSFQISGGVDDRQLQTAGAGSTLNPIFGVSIQYQPFKNTRISLGANRTVSSSDYYTAAQTAENTSANLNLNQRLFGKYNLTLGTGYAQSDYAQDGTTSGKKRGDEIYSFSAGLSHPLLKRGSWSLSYQYSDNRSSQGGFGYHSNQIGFSVSYAY